MPVIGHRMADAATRERSESLLSEATQLWLAQAAFADQIPDNATRSRTIDLIAEASTWTVRSLSAELEDQFVELSSRLSTLPLLEILFRFQVGLMKLHIDRADVDAFEATWKRWIDWGQGWDPGSQIDDLRLEIEIPAEPARKRRAQQEIAAAQQLSEAKERLNQTREGAWLQLGAWAAKRYRDEAVSRPVLERLSPHLAGPFDSDAIARWLQRYAAGGAPLELLTDWELATWERIPGVVTTGYPAERDDLRFWLALLLARACANGSATDLGASGLPEWMTTELRETIGTIEAESQRWLFLIESQASLARATDALDRAEKAGRAAEEERLATAPLDGDRVRAFTEAQRRAIEQAPLRRQLLTSGALQVTEADDAHATPTWTLQRRSLFVDRGSLTISEAGPAEDQRTREEDRVYDVVREHASPVEEGGAPVDAVLAKIASLRHAGSTPDAILISRSVFVRPALMRSQAFEPSRPSFEPPPKLLGTLDGVSIFEVGPLDANELVLIDSKAAIEVVERKRPNDPSSLLVDVREISPERAIELVESGFRFPDGGDWSAQETAAEIPRRLVETVVELDFDIQARPDIAHAAFKVVLPNAADELRSRPRTDGG